MGNKATRQIDFFCQYPLEHMKSGVKNDDEQAKKRAKRVRFN